MDKDTSDAIFENLNAIPHRDWDGYPPLERLAVVVAALEIVPRGKRTKGTPGLITGETTDASPSVTEALRVARFALDPYSDLPGVDVAWHPKEVKE